jgi:CubicO group peptidase (beta-lactamase class C family)
MKKKHTWLVVGLMFVSVASHADAIDDEVTAQMERMHIPGVALAVLKTGKPIKQQGYGYANLELKTPVTVDSVFKIGSVSKQFIASGIMVLAGEGKITLDDKINKYLEGGPATWEPITIRHLLNHTSGLVRESPGFDPLKIQTEADVIKKAYDVPLQFAPGEKMVYCNLGYFILAEIISKASGTPWPHFIEKRVFAPAGMKASRPTDMKPLISNRANGYRFTREGGYENAAILFANRPSGAFLSSLADLVKWEQALVSGSVLSQSTLAEMWRPTKLASGALSHYGYGWVLEPLNGHAQINHGGSLSGFRSFYLRLPKDDLTVIVLANADGAATDTIAIGVAEHFVPGLFPTRTAIKLAKAQLEPYVGRYQLGPAGVATVSIVNDTLAMTVGPMGDLQFAPESSSLFFLPADRRVQARFTTMSDGKLELAYLVNGSPVLSGPKLP